MVMWGPLMGMKTVKTPDMKLVSDKNAFDPKLNMILAIGCFALYFLVYFMSNLNFGGIQKVLFHMIILLFPATSFVAIGQIVHNEKLSTISILTGYFLFAVSMLSIIVNAFL
jgi:hypothetical protein